MNVGGRRHAAVYTPGSVDSWDMENLRFLRKISEGRPCYPPSELNYVSDNDSAVYDEEEEEECSPRGRLREEQEIGEKLDQALYSGATGFAMLNQKIVLQQMQSLAAAQTGTLKDPYLEEESPEGDQLEPLPLIRSQCLAGRRGSTAGDNFDRRFMKSRKPKPSLVTLGFMEPQLEDCYVLDVVTVRNESVLAERGAGSSHLGAEDSESEGSGGGGGLRGILRLNNSRRNGGSAGLPSSSSSSVSSDEFTTAREGFFGSSSVDEDEPIEIQPRVVVHHNPLHTDTEEEMEELREEEEEERSCSPVSVVVRGECTARYPAPHQEQLSSERSFETASSNYYYLGQQQQEEVEYVDRGAVDQGAAGGESPPPRSISPYYVRLRRDLLPPSYTPPHPRQPWNFGMNRQGLLVIDYSPNWDGLETYVRNLSLG